jgi:phosphohistidine phosphatase SixA
MIPKRPLFPPSRRVCRIMLDRIKVSAKVRAQATASEAKKDGDRAKNECLPTEFPTHDLMEGIQFHHTPSNCAHSPFAATEVNNMTSAFQLMAIAAQTDGSATNAFAMVVPENKLQQNLQRSTILKLPSEVRCLIYEQVFLVIVEGAEMVAFTRQLAGRAYQSVPLREQTNALPHTCRILRKECAPIYEEISYRANDSRITELEDVFSDDSLPPTSGSPWVLLEKHLEHTVATFEGS